MTSWKCMSGIAQALSSRAILTAAVELINIKRAAAASLDNGSLKRSHPYERVGLRAIQFA